MSGRNEIVVKDSCGNCKLFNRIKAEDVGKIAGVSKHITGTCSRKKLSYNEYPEYRAETDWCDQYKPARG